MKADDFFVGPVQVRGVPCNQRHRRKHTGTLESSSLPWRQPRRGCRGHIPQYFGWGRQREYPPNIIIDNFIRKIIAAQLIQR